MPISKVVAKTPKLEVADPQDFKWLVSFSCSGPNGDYDSSVVVNAHSGKAAQIKAMDDLSRSGHANVRIHKVAPYMGLAASVLTKGKEIKPRISAATKPKSRAEALKIDKEFWVHESDKGGGLWYVYGESSQYCYGEFPDEQEADEAIEKLQGGLDSKKEKSSLKEMARIKGEDEYEWFVYTGAEIHAANDKGRNLILHKGDRYGARKSSNGKQIRLITEEQGPTKVFTCDAELAALLAKRSKVARVKSAVTAKVTGNS